MRASISTASCSPLINETAVAGQVALPSLIGGISPTIGLYGATNVSRWSGLDMDFETLLPRTTPRPLDRCTRSSGFPVRASSHPNLARMSGHTSVARPMDVLTDV